MTAGDLTTVPWLVRYTVRRTTYANAGSSEWDPVGDLFRYGKRQVQGGAYAPNLAGWEDLAHAVEHPIETIWDRAPYFRDDHTAQFSRNSNAPIRRHAGKRTIVVSAAGLRAIHDLQAECLLKWQSVQNELLGRDTKTWVRETRLKLTGLIENPNPIEMIASLDTGHMRADLCITLTGRW